MFKYFILLLGGLIFLPQCGSKNQPSKTANRVFYPFEDTETVSELDSYILSAEVILPALEQDILMARVEKMLIGNNGKLYIYDAEAGPIILNRDGVFEKKIANRGRGPMEYLNVEDIALGANEEELMLLTSTNKILCYGLNDSTFRVIDAKINFPADAIAPAKNDGAYLYGAYPLDKSDLSKQDPLLVEVNKSGQIINEFVERKDITFTLYNITQTHNNQYLLRPQDSEHIVYQLAKDSIKPKYQIDFGEKNIPARYYYNEAQENLPEYLQSPYFKFPHYIQETDEILFFKAGGPRYEHSFVYSLKGGKGIHWPDGEDDGSIIKIRASDDTFLYAIVPQEVVETSLNNHGPLHKYIVNLIRNSGFNEVGGNNPFIVKIQFEI